MHPYTLIPSFTYKKFFDFGKNFNYMYLSMHVLCAVLGLFVIGI